MSDFIYKSDLETFLKNLTENAEELIDFGRFNDKLKGYGMQMAINNIKKFATDYKARKFLYISGYWKSDKQEFTDHKVSELDDYVEDEDVFDAYDEDNEIFYYGLTEDMVKKAIEMGINSDYEFVIISYHK